MRIRNENAWQPRSPQDLLPLRQCVQAADGAPPVFPPGGPQEWLSKPEKFEIAGFGDGCEIRAAGEAALGEAQQLLRQAYGELLTFGAPAVHSYVDADSGSAMEPVMFLRIDASRRHGDTLLQELADRRATVQEVDLLRDRVVLRAEAPLAALLGLHGRLLATAGTGAHVLCWLQRYQPVTTVLPDHPPVDKPDSTRGN